EPGFLSARPAIVARSSNGKTTDSDSVNRGSNPRRASIFLYKNQMFMPDWPPSDRLTGISFDSRVLPWCLADSRPLHATNLRHGSWPTTQRNDMHAAIAADVGSGRKAAAPNSGKRGYLLQNESNM